MLHYTSLLNTAMPIVQQQSNESKMIRSGSASLAALMNESNNDSIDNTKWIYEEITLERGPAGLGFTVAGGVDKPHYANDHSIYITSFISNGPAATDGRLKLEDIIVRVDDVDLIDVNHSEAVAALKNSGNRVQLLIKRRSPVLVTNTNLDKSKSKNHSPSRQSSHQQSKQIKKNNTTSSPLKYFTSINNNQNQLPPLPKSNQSGSSIQRGSIHYASTREGGKYNAPKLKLSSSSLSLQTPDENGSNFSKDNDNNNIHFGNIDFDEVKKLTRLPRTVNLKRTSKGLGFNIVGGLAGGGTFISFIVPGGVAERSGKLYCGDQILSVNGIDLTHATHKEAATSLMEAGQSVKLVVKYRPEDYIKFENKLNDYREKNMLTTGTIQTSQKRSLYARALFEYDPSKDSGLPSRGLSFRFGDILHIINASDDEWWRARKVLENGQDDTINGIIPSKKRVEKRERARLKSVKFINRNCSESTLDRRKKKFSFSKKFPFMKSRENMTLDYDECDFNNSQSNSRAVLSSSSTTSINNHNNSEKGSIMKYDGDETILSYEPVLQQDIDYARPLALYGPLKDEIEALRDDLSCDSRFYRMESIVPYTTRPPKEGEIDGVKYHFVSMQEMKRDLLRHKFVEAGELNNNLYGTSIDSIRSVAEAGKHCLLNISPKALKRLHDANLYPVTIFIKPKSIESLLEMNKRWTQDEAIAAMAQANRMEQEYGNYFTATIQLESPNEVLSEIMKTIEQHSGPKIWIPTTFEALNVFP